MGIFTDFCNMRAKDLVDSINRFYSNNRGFIFIHKIDFKEKRFDYYVFKGLDKEYYNPSFSIQFDEGRGVVSVSFFNIVRPDGVLFFKTRYKDYYFSDGGNSVISYIFTRILSSAVFNYYYLPVIFPPNYNHNILNKDFYDYFDNLSKDSGPVYVDKEGAVIPSLYANDIFNKFLDEFEGEVVF